MELEKLLNQTLQLTPDSFGIFDPDNILVYCNKQFAEIFAIDQDSAIGMSHGELMRNAYESEEGLHIETEDFEAWLEDVESRHRQQDHRYFESDLKDGRWFRVTQVVLEGDYVALWGTDITELKETKLQLKNALEEVSRLARVDELTGVLNRRAFIELARKEMTRCVRYKNPVTVVILDIDFFKEVNDNYGHSSGDDVLRYFASFFQNSIRETDIFARIGGEEFVLFLPETDEENGMLLADRLREQLSQCCIPIQNGEKTIQITVSSGLCSVLEEGEDLDMIMARADQALYTAKDAGRNCCISASH